MGHSGWAQGDGMSQFPDGEDACVGLVSPGRLSACVWQLPGWGRDLRWVSGQNTYLEGLLCLVFSVCADPGSLTIWCGIPHGGLRRKGGGM